MPERGNLLFQLTAALIPVFLLATAGSRLFSPRRLLGDKPDRRVAVFVAYAVLLTFILIAEVFAIELSFAVDPLYRRRPNTDPLAPVQK